MRSMKTFLARYEATWVLAVGVELTLYLLAKTWNLGMHMWDGIDTTCCASAWEARFACTTSTAVHTREFRQSKKPPQTSHP